MFPAHDASQVRAILTKPDALLIHRTFDAWDLPNQKRLVRFLR